MRALPFFGADEGEGAEGVRDGGCRDRCALLHSEHVGKETVGLGVLALARAEEGERAFGAAALKDAMRAGAIQDGERMPQLLFGEGELPVVDEDEGLLGENRSDAQVVGAEFLLIDGAGVAV